MKALVNIGKILKTHGLKGHVKVFVDAAYMDDLEETLESVFIEGLPYFIKNKDINTDEQAILLLEDVESKEQAQKLCGKAIQVPEDKLTEIPNAKYYSEWIGFLVTDRKLGEIGSVQDILEMPQQVMLQVLHQGREVLIPLNDDLVPGIDIQQKRITTDLPEGFLAIF
jgi:16S rRNA processing protein RimM